jgi:Arc/MetJ family transcription regulator
VARTVPPLTRVLAAATALAVAAGAAFLATRDDEPVPTGYRVVYAVQLDDRALTETVEVLGLVSRRLTSGSAAGTATTESGVYDLVDGSWRQLATVPPGEVGSRVQLTAALAWAESVGRARRDGEGRVADLPCTWWLTREPLDGAPVAPPETQDRTRSCVDARGRLLADAWTSAGREVRTRTATSVEPLSSLDPFDGATPSPLDPRLAPTAVEAVDPEGSPPAGCAWTRGARVVEGAPGTTDVARRVRRSVADCGGSLLVVDRVTVTAGPPEPTGDVAVSVGNRPARVRAAAGGLAVELVDGADLVRVRADLPVADLVAWLESGALR